MIPLSVQVSQTFPISFPCNHEHGQPVKRCDIQAVGNQGVTILTICLGGSHNQLDDLDVHQHKTVTTSLPHYSSAPPPPYSREPPSMPDPGSRETDV